MVPPITTLNTWGVSLALKDDISGVLSVNTFTALFYDNFDALVWQSQLTPTPTTSILNGVSGIGSVYSNASSIISMKNATISSGVGASSSVGVLSSNGSIVIINNITTTPNSPITSAPALAPVAASVCASERGCDQGVTVTSACQVSKMKGKKRHITERERKDISNEHSIFIYFYFLFSFSSLLLTHILLSSPCS